MKRKEIFTPCSYIYTVDFEYVLLIIIIMNTLDLFTALSTEGGLLKLYY